MIDLTANVLNVTDVNINCTKEHVISTNVNFVQLSVLPTKGETYDSKYCLYFVSWFNLC